MIFDCLKLVHIVYIRYLKYIEQLISFKLKKDNVITICSEVANKTMFIYFIIKSNKNIKFNFKIQ